MFWKKKKVTVKSDALDLSSALNIDDDRAMYIFNTTHKIISDYVLQDRGNNKVEALQKICQEIDIKNDKEYLLLGISFETALHGVARSVQQAMIDFASVVNDPVFKKHRTIN